MRTRFLWLIVVVLSFSGCAGLQKSNPAPAPKADWGSVGGQVRYADSKRTFIADVAIRTGQNSREYSMEVTKSGVLLLKLDRAASLAWATGPLAHWPFSGSVEKAPAHLEKWFAATTVALEGKAPPTSNASGIQFRLQR